MDKVIELYRPSNGTEGSCFKADWCERCERQRRWYEDNEEPCQIELATEMYGIDEPEYPKEWHYAADGNPVCSAFVPDGEEIHDRCPKTIDLFPAAEGA